jgi:hypothetical protein
MVQSNIGGMNIQFRILFILLASTLIFGCSIFKKSESKRQSAQNGLSNSVISQLKNLALFLVKKVTFLDHWI